MGKHEFFRKVHGGGWALSYDDVRLKTAYSAIHPSDTNLTSRFSRRVEVHIPIISSPMDTVTESQMAIAMAKFGGLGIIHRNLDPKSQAAEVARVKHHLNGRISNPICVHEDDTVEEILDRRTEKGWGFHSFPVISADGELLGIITENDFSFCVNSQATAAEIMTTNVVTAPAGTDLSRAYEIMRSKKKKMLPLLNENRTIAGMYTFTDVKRIKTGNAEKYNVDSNGQLCVGAAIGTGDAELARAVLLANEKVNVLVIDSAHADTESVIKGMLLPLKAKFPHIDIVAGNVSEGSSAKRLVEAGADGIRVGQGPGSICTTRIVTGVGCPQVSAIWNCVEAAEASGVPICADGGIKESGDITIAIGVGAHTVMLGRLLAGTDEAPGQVVTIRGIRHKAYRGMGSLGAMQDNQASRQRYGQQGTGKDQIVPEGIEGAVPYQGSVENLLHQYAEGLRRGMGYTGSPTIGALQKNADFYRITNAGLSESHPHGVDHIQQAPNYHWKG